MSDIDIEAKLLRGYLKKIMYAKENGLKVEILRYGTYKTVKGFITDIEEGGLITIKYFDMEETFSIGDVRSLKIYYENNKHESKKDDVKNAEPV